MARESKKAEWIGVFLAAASLLVAVIDPGFRCAVGISCPAVVIAPPPPPPVVDLLPAPGPPEIPEPPPSTAIQEVYHENIPPALGDTLELLTARGGRIRSVAMAPGGSWVVLHDRGKGIAYDENAPPDLLHHLRELLREGRRPEQIVFTPFASGGWIAIDNTGHLEQRGAPADLLAALGGSDSGVRAVSISSAGWVLLGGQNTALFKGILPSHLRDLLEVRAAAPLISLAMGPGNGFVAVQQDGRWVDESVPLSLHRYLEGLHKAGRRVELVALSPENEGWVVIALPAPQPHD
jgi:hypothetical protein